MSISTNRLKLAAILGSCILWQAGYSFPVTDSVILYTPYTKITVNPGQTVNFAIDLMNNSKERINTDLNINGLPAGWNPNLKANGYDVRQVFVLPGEKKSVTLILSVPLKVNKGNYPFRVVAGNLASLPLSITILEQGTYKSEFFTNQPNMQGSSGTNFSFYCTLKNMTGDRQSYALMANAQLGWTVLFKFGGRQISSLDIDANASSNVSVEITPPDTVEAGTYRIPVTATSSLTTSEIGLEVVITGTYGIDLTTPTGLLSASITAGDQRRIELAVKNTWLCRAKGYQAYFKLAYELGCYLRSEKNRQA